MRRDKTLSAGFPRPSPSSLSILSPLTWKKKGKGEKKKERERLRRSVLLAASLNSSKIKQYHRGPGPPVTGDKMLAKKGGIIQQINARHQRRPPVSFSLLSLLSLPPLLFAYQECYTCFHQSTTRPSVLPNAITRPPLNQKRWKQNELHICYTEKKPQVSAGVSAALFYFFSPSLPLPSPLSHSGAASE